MQSEILESSSASLEKADKGKRLSSRVLPTKRLVPSLSHARIPTAIPVCGSCNGSREPRVRVILHSTWMRRVICGSQAVLKETNEARLIARTPFALADFSSLSPPLPAAEFRNLAVAIAIAIYICPVSDIRCDNFRRWNENAHANVALMLNLRYSAPLHAIRPTSHREASRNPVCHKRGRFCIFMPCERIACYVLSV